MWAGEHGHLGVALPDPGVLLAPAEARDAGFQIATLPINAGDVDRLPPIAVKLNGETAYTKPSRPR